MGTGAQMVAEAGQSQGGSAGRCERAQEGTGGAIGGMDALTHPTPHTLPTDATGRTTGHAGRQIVRRGGAGHGTPSEPRRGHTEPPQGTTGAQGGRRYLLIWKTHPQPPQKPTQPRRLSEGVTAHPQPGTHRTGHGEAPHGAQRGTVAQRPHLAPIPPRRCRTAPTPPQSRRAGNSHGARADGVRRKKVDRI